MMGEYVFSTQPEGSILILGRSGFSRFLDSTEEVERFMRLLEQYDNPWNVDEAVNAYLAGEGKEN